jgi:hypothetical protein
VVRHAGSVWSCYLVAGGQARLKCAPNSRRADGLASLRISFSLLHVIRYEQHIIREVLQHAKTDNSCIIHPSSAYAFPNVYFWTMCPLLLFRYRGFNVR